MKTSIKFILAFFLTGIILGLIFSPFTSKLSKKELLSPTTDLYAYWQGDQLKIEKKKNKNTMQKYFEKYDREQGFEKKEDKRILGDKDAKNKQNQTNETDFTVSSRTGTITIAIIGDSMVDTMETGLPYLEKYLKAYFPKIKFNLLNYGIGSENIITANKRIEENYNYKDRSYPVLSQLDADLIIIESFAYNPLGNEDKDLKTHSLTINSMVDKLQTEKTKIVFLAAICPIKKDFGKGPNGVNWDIDTAWTHATKIQNFLENGIRTAKEIGLPIIDTYNPSKLPNGEGIKNYVSTNDGIHPSKAGHDFMAKTIFNKLLELKLL